VQASPRGIGMTGSEKPEVIVVLVLPENKRSAQSSVNRLCIYCVHSVAFNAAWKSASVCHRPHLRSSTDSLPMSGNASQFPRNRARKHNGHRELVEPPGQARVGALCVRLTAGLRAVT